jgi:hypothetical protein
MTLLGTILALLIFVAAGCTSSDDPHLTRHVVSEDVPWTVTIPSGWEVSTDRSEPDPNLRVGVLTTHISNVRYSFGFDQMAPGPNSGHGASEMLGPSAAVVKVMLLWSPADEPIGWNPPTSSTTVRSPTMWHDDAQNPGWVFRERKVCLSDTCVWVLEWHGPDATDEITSSIQRITRSVELDPGWIDPVA